MEYRNTLNILKKNYNDFYNECDKTIKEVLEYIDNFNINLRKFKNANDYSFNICNDLLNTYQYLKNKNCLNYEVIENINSILNFNDIKFNMDKNFNCLARLIYINSIIKLEYNTLFKLCKNFINYDMKITEEEEKLIKAKNNNNINLKYQKVINYNFNDIYYGYFDYKPDSSETEFIINGFGIIVNKHYKYIGEFKHRNKNGFGIYYFEDGSCQFNKFNHQTLEEYKLYGTSGEVQFCKFTKIVEKYQKYGVICSEIPNGTKKINIIKNNNFDDYGIMYNINGELYEGYYKSNVKDGYGILNSESEGVIVK